MEGFPSTQASAQFPRTPRRTVPTVFGRGAPFRTQAARIGGRRTSFDARVYGKKTSSHPKTLSVSRSWVLGERYTGRRSWYDVMRRRTEGGRADGAVPCGAAGAAAAINW